MLGRFGQQVAISPHGEGWIVGVAQHGLARLPRRPSAKAQPSPAVPIILPRIEIKIQADGSVAFGAELHFSPIDELFSLSIRRAL